MILIIADFVKSLTFLDIKDFFVRQKDQIKASSPIMLNKLKNLFITNLDLGLYHFYKGNLSDAILRFKFIRLMKKTNPLGWYYLGRCALIQHNQKKAMSMFEHSLMLEANHLPSKFYVNVIKNSFSDSVPVEVIKEEFEYKAYYYVKEYLIEKNYIAHKLVFDELLSVFGREISGINILDIGCGTGVCGHFLKICSVCKIVDGVDLSENMLKIAQKCAVDGKAVYNSLVQDDYIDFLSNNKKKYDAIVATFVFNYQSDLERAITPCISHLSSVGVIIVILLTTKDNFDVMFAVKKNLFLFSKDYLQSIVSRLSSKLSLDFVLAECKPCENEDGVMITFSHRKP